MIFKTTTKIATRLPLRTSKRFIRLNPGQLGAVKGWGTVLNIVAGAYFGGLAICCGLLYWLYQDANERQNIPFELSFKNQIESVKAINKDDVLRSPQYAEKHYRKILQDISNDPNECEGYDVNDPYDFPMIKSSILLNEKSNKFANFYIDMIIRYAKALMLRNKIDSSIKILQKIIDNDDIFFNIGNSEALSEACQLLARLDKPQQETYIKRSIEMLCRTHAPFLKIDENYLIQDNSKITNEFINSLNQLAFTLARSNDLNDALNIYLSNLNILTGVQQKLQAGELSKRNFPLFNIEKLNLTIQIAEIKAHISEIIWAKGYKKNAISWGEEVVDLIYYDYNASSKVAPLLIDTLQNLSKMYKSIKDPVNQSRCERMLQGIEVFPQDRQQWHDETLARFSKIIYSKGPLGIIEKAITERYGDTKAVPNLEDFDTLE